MKQLIQAFTMNTIIKVAFGIEVNCMEDENNEIIVKAKKIFNTDISPKMILLSLILTFFPKLAKLLQLTMTNETFQFFIDLSKKVVEEKRKQLNKSPTNFIELLLAAEKENKEEAKRKIEEILMFPSHFFLRCEGRRCCCAMCAVLHWRIRHNCHDNHTFVLLACTASRQTRKVVR